jgi:hypothetical protein
VPLNALCGVLLVLAEEYIRDKPDVWPVQIRPPGVGPFGPPHPMKPMTVAAGVAMSLTTNNTSSTS